MKTNIKSKHFFVDGLPRMLQTSPFTKNAKGFSKIYELCLARNIPCISHISRQGQTDLCNNKKENIAQDAQDLGKLCFQLLLTIKSKPDFEHQWVKLCGQPLLAGKFNSSPRKSALHAHNGIDLTRNDDDLIGILHEFATRNPITRLMATSQGLKSFFVFKNTDLLHLEVSNQLLLNEDGPVSLIEALQLCELPRFCSDNVVAVKEKCLLQWRLGMIKLLEVMPTSKQLVIQKWKGTVKKLGTPDFILRSVKQ